MNQKVENASSYAAYIHDQIKIMASEYIAKPCTILDFGCGNGIVTNFIKNTFFKAIVFGIDKQEVIEEAKNQFSEIEFYALEKDRLPFDDATFDLIYAVDVFHHIPYGQHELTIQEIMRVLKPQGTFLLFEVNPYNLFALYRFKKDPLEKMNRMLTPSYARQLFQRFSCSITLRYFFLSDFLPIFLKKYIHYFHYLPFGSVYCVQVYKK